MIRCEKNVWKPTSAYPKKVGQAAKKGKVGHDRSALRRDNGKTASRMDYPRESRQHSAWRSRRMPLRPPKRGLRDAK